jgi:hypothetical protein
MRRRTLLVVLNALLLVQASVGAQAACAQLGAALAQGAHTSAPCPEHATGLHASHSTPTHDAPRHTGSHDCCHTGAGHCATVMAAGAPSVSTSAPCAVPCASAPGQSLMRPRPDELLRPPIL